MRTDDPLSKMRRYYDRVKITLFLFLYVTKIKSCLLRLPNREKYPKVSIPRTQKMMSEVLNRDCVNRFAINRALLSTWPHCREKLHLKKN